MIRFFESPPAPGSSYPITLAQLQDATAKFPAETLAGLYAVGLAPAYSLTKAPYADYTRSSRHRGPVIHTYSFQDSRSFRQPGGRKRHYLDAVMDSELYFGMRLEREGSGWRCIWTEETLSRYLLEFVLAHEIGHHVHWCQRKPEWRSRLSYYEREKFADHFAWRRLRQAERHARASTGVVEE